MTRNSGASCVPFARSSSRGKLWNQPGNLVAPERIERIRKGLLTNIRPSYSAIRFGPRANVARLVRQL